MKLWSRTKKHKNIVDLRCCRLFFALSMAWQTYARTEIWLCICPFFMIVSHCMWIGRPLTVGLRWFCYQNEKKQCRQQAMQYAQRIEFERQTQQQQQKSQSKVLLFCWALCTHTCDFSEGMPLFWLVFVVNNSSFLMFLFCSSMNLNSILSNKKTCCTPAYWRLSLVLFF